MQDFTGRVGEGIDNLKSTLKRKTDDMKNEMRTEAKSLLIQYSRLSGW
jgi:hypothetical protein